MFPPLSRKELWQFIAVWLGLTLVVAVIISALMAIFMRNQDIPLVFAYICAIGVYMLFASFFVDWFVGIMRKPLRYDIYLLGQAIRAAGSIVKNVIRKVQINIDKPSNKAF